MAAPVARKESEFAPGDPPDADFVRWRPPWRVDRDPFGIFEFRNVVEARAAEYSNAPIAHCPAPDQKGTDCPGGS